MFGCQKGNAPEGCSYLLAPNGQILKNKISPPLTSLKSKLTSKIIKDHYSISTCTLYWKVYKSNNRFFRFS